MIKDSVKEKGFLGKLSEHFNRTENALQKKFCRIIGNKEHEIKDKFGFKEKPTPKIFVIRVVEEVKKIKSKEKL